MEKVDVQFPPRLLKDLVVGNKVFRSASDHRLTERDLEKARRELKETDLKKTICLEELKTMLSKDECVRYRMDDDYLLRFLRFRKFDVKRAYKFIHNFYAERNKNPLLYTLSPNFESQLRGKFASVLPYTHDNGEIVVIHRLGDWNPSEISVRDFCVMFSYSCDVVSMNPHGQIDGLIEIMDVGRLSARQISQLIYPPSLKFLIKFLQELYPWRIKKVIIFNCSAVLLASIYFVLSFLKKNISDRVVLLRSDLKELHKHVNPEILPKEYGGKIDDEECYSYLLKVVSSNAEYVRYENSFIGQRE